MSVDAQPPPRGHAAITDFLRQCHQAIVTTAAHLPHGAPELAGARALDTAIGSATAVEYEPTWLPALDTISQVGADTNDVLVDQFVALAPLLPWTPTFRSNDGGTNLALGLFNETFDLGDTTIGLMYVSPGETYPLHQHPPQELYLTISGSGEWRYGGNAHSVHVGPGKLLYNHPNDLHSATAGSEPLVALFVLW